MALPLIVGNWKMHKTVKEAVDFAASLKQRFNEAAGRSVALAPPFTALYAVAEVIKGTAIGLAAQNVSDRDEGAFTGEVSAAMLFEAGCGWVIVGHSERRSIFGEKDDLINRKVGAVLKRNLRPILCVGEILAEREAGETFNVVRRQIESGLADISAADLVGIVIAYEPVWAIGTGKTATPAQAAEVHAFIRETVAGKYGADAAGAMPVIYGGSVNTGNIDALMAEREINGVLVGGASLDVESFARIAGLQ